MNIINFARYPTKEEILEGDAPSYIPEIVGGTKHFKKLWRNLEGNNEARCELLVNLLQGINQIMNGEELCIAKGQSYCYRMDTKTIYIAEPLSIISALHELGHHLKGRSELEACRFSVHLFKQCFPNAYEKLVWDGHMLKRQ